MNGKFVAFVVSSLLFAGCASVGNQANVRDYTVTITNETSNLFLTPILAVGHGERAEDMFRFGKVASPELQAVAEGGNVKPMAKQFEGEHIVVDPYNGLLGPGQSVTFNLNGSATRMSVIAMILPTNDGFVVLDNALIRVGVQELYAVDAGTESNTEHITGGGEPNTPGIPHDPSGQADHAATGIEGLSPEGSVGRHPGIIGGTGSALNPATHGWKGPVATIRIRN